jgi:hypothetical protein
VTTLPSTAHKFDEDAVCIHCGFDGAEWSHWKRHTYEGRASEARQPLCERRPTMAERLSRPGASETN